MQTEQKTRLGDTLQDVFGLIGVYNICPDFLLKQKRSGFVRALCGQSEKQYKQYTIRRVLRMAIPFQYF